MKSPKIFRFVFVFVVFIRTCGRPSTKDRKDSSLSNITDIVLSSSSASGNTENRNHNEFRRNITCMGNYTIFYMESALSEKSMPTVDLFAN